MSSNTGRKPLTGTLTLNNRLLIGSRAVKKYYPEVKLRRREKISQSDVDYLVREKPRVSAEAEDFTEAPYILDNYTFGDVATLDELYTLKISHSEWEFKDWDKHIADAYAMRQAGASLVPELYAIAYKQWELKKGKKNINLNKDKEEFFTSGVRRKYEHDSVHAAVAYNDDPMYMRILKDDAEVMTSAEKFKNLTEEEKIMLAQEEVMVLSLERDLIPNGEPMPFDIHTSYRKQLRLLITRYSKGWFPLWMIQNYHLIATPSVDYWNKFQNSGKKILIT